MDSENPRQAGPGAVHTVFLPERCPPGAGGRVHTKNGTALCTGDTPSVARRDASGWFKGLAKTQDGHPRVAVLYGTIDVQPPWVQGELGSRDPERHEVPYHLIDPTLYPGPTGRRADVVEWGWVTALLLHGDDAGTRVQKATGGAGHAAPPPGAVTRRVEAVARWSYLFRILERKYSRTAALLAEAAPAAGGSGSKACEPKRQSPGKRAKNKSSAARTGERESDTHGGTAQGGTTNKMASHASEQPGARAKPEETDGSSTGRQDKTRQAASHPGDRGNPGETQVVAGKRSKTKTTASRATEPLGARAEQEEPNGSSTTHTADAANPGKTEPNGAGPSAGRKSKRAAKRTESNAKPEQADESATAHTAGAANPGKTEANGAGPSTGRKSKRASKRTEPNTKPEQADRSSTGHHGVRSDNPETGRAGGEAAAPSANSNPPRADARAKRWPARPAAAWLAVLAADLALGAAAADLLHSRCAGSAGCTPVDRVLALALGGQSACASHTKWLLGWPAGFKGNTALNTLIGTLALSAIDQGRALLSLAVETGSFACPNTAAVRVVFVVSGAGLGASGVGCLAADVLGLLFANLSVVFVLCGGAYRPLKQAAAELSRLLRNRRYNVLRGRVDVHSYDACQKLVGTLLFTLAAFLLPTVIVYFLTFALVHAALRVAQECIFFAASLFLSVPFVALAVYPFAPARDRAFRVAVAHEFSTAQTVVVRLQQKGLPLAALCEEPAELARHWLRNGPLPQLRRLFAEGAPIPYTDLPA